MGAMYGRITIGMLIKQDILAVLFLTFSTSKVPTRHAIPLLLALLFGRKCLSALISRSGHGEMIALCGLFLALVVGAESFEVVGLKADLGALFIGVLVGSHSKAKELSKSLLGVTDLLLVGFLLQIGLMVALSWDAVLWAILLIALLPLKSLAFFVILTRFHLRARTAWMAAFNLSTYSEFGLIAMALALSLSILIMAPLSRKAEALYDPISDFLKRFETAGQHPDDLPIQTKGERIGIFDMGRVGVAAYSTLQDRFPGQVIGFDRDPASVEMHQLAGRNVLLADSTDSDFWERVLVNDNLDLVVLAMPKHGANIHAAQTLKRHEFEGVVAATGKFDDEVKQLRCVGLDTAFNLYSEAGSGFSDHVFNVFTQQRPDLANTWNSREE